MDEIDRTVLKFAAARRAVTDSQLAVLVGGETPAAQGSVTRLIGESLLSRSNHGNRTSLPSGPERAPRDAVSNSAHERYPR
jgi:hypothetical protein